VDSLLKSLNNAPSGHFTTGIFGTKYILEAVSKYVSPEKVFEIVNSREYPGWGFMMDNGATTIWETWKEGDNVYSNCHPMFGTVTEWFYRWLGGIRPDPEYPGFEKFRLLPTVPDDLEQVKCNYQSPYGMIVSNWKQEKNKVTYSIEIPLGSTAVVELKKEASQEINFINDSDSGFDPQKLKGLQQGRFELPSGKYTISVY
jgi:alpha-L-rhamnosidase